MHKFNHQSASDKVRDLRLHMHDKIGLILAGECNALLASGSDPTCNVGRVKKTYKSLQTT